VRAEALLLHSDYTAEFVSGEIKDGYFMFDYKGEKYSFRTSELRPLIVRRFLFSKPLYVFKYSTQIPLAFVKKEGETREELVPPEKLLPILQIMGFKDRTIQAIVHKTTIEPVTDAVFYENELKLSPKIAGDTTDMRFLHELMKYVGEKPPVEMRKLILIIIGASILLFVLFYALSNPQGFRKILNI
jgi:hypothetical protein